MQHHSLLAHCVLCRSHLNEYFYEYMLAFLVMPGALFTAGESDLLREWLEHSPFGIAQRCYSRHSFRDCQRHVLNLLSSGPLRARIHVCTSFGLG